MICRCVHTTHILWKVQNHRLKCNHQLRNYTSKFCILYGHLITCIWYFVCVVNACLHLLLCKSRYDVMVDNVLRKKFLHSKLCEEFVHHHGNQLIVASWWMHQVRINHFETVKHCSKWTHKIWKTNETKWNSETLTNPNTKLLAWGQV